MMNWKWGTGWNEKTPPFAGWIYNTGINLTLSTAWRRKLHHLRNKTANTIAIWTQIVNINVVLRNALASWNVPKSFRSERSRKLQDIWKAVKLHMWSGRRAAVPDIAVEQSSWRRNGRQYKVLHKVTIHFMGTLLELATSNFMLTSICVLWYAWKPIHHLFGRLERFDGGFWFWGNCRSVGQTILVRVPWFPKASGLGEPD